MTDADWENVTYYVSESVLFHHKAINDMHAAASNLFKDKATLARFRLENGIDVGLDDRIVVADVLVAFYLQMRDYLLQYPTLPNRIARFDVEPFV